MSQLQNGYNWTDGEICTAAHLNQMLNSATLNAEAVSGQTVISTALADLALVAQNSSGELRSSTVNSILNTGGSALRPLTLTNFGEDSITVNIDGGMSFIVNTTGGTGSSAGGYITLDAGNTLSLTGDKQAVLASSTTSTDPTVGNTYVRGTTVTIQALAAGGGAGEIALEGNVTVTGRNNIMPTGCVMLFANSSVPSGWVKCNGVAVSRTSSTYHELFLAIGTIYGSGDGVNTFNLPDLRGEFVRGWDDGRGVDTGRAIGSAQDQQLEKHKHIASNNDCQSYASVNGVGTGTYNTWCDTGGVATNASAALTGDGGHIEQTAKLGTETRPRNKAMMYCIKL